MVCNLNEVGKMCTEGLPPDNICIVSDPSCPWKATQTGQILLKAHLMLNN